MAKQTAIGIDIGTREVKIVIGDRIRQNGKILQRIIGYGRATSKGLRHGYIINSSDVVKSIREALATAQGQSRTATKRAFLAIGGVGIEATTAIGSVVISRADAEITSLDVERAIQASEEALPQTAILNRKILHTIPQQYKLDGKEVLGRPSGMKGVKLEVKTLFVTCLEQHLADLIAAVEEAGIDVEDVIAAPFAAGIVNLTKAEKIAGCVLANIGAETVSIAVYENNMPISLKVFPIGGADITKDIALGLQVPLEEAEHAKLGSRELLHPRKRLEEIITARLTDIFELIESHLKKIGKSGLLPAGIILTGGSSSLSSVETLAKTLLKLPAARAHVSTAGNQGQYKESTWSVAYGLCMLGLGTEDDGTRAHLLRNTKKSVWNWVRQYLP